MNCQHTRQINVAVQIDEQVIAERKMCAECYKQVCFNWGEEDFKRWIETGEINESQELLHDTSGDA